MLTVVDLNKKIPGRTFFHGNCNHCNQKQNGSKLHFDENMNLSLKLELVLFVDMFLCFVFVDV